MFNLKFKSWVEAIIPFEMTRKIRRGLKHKYKQDKSARKYSPGTFGVEIEFRVGGDDDEIRKKLYNNKNVLKNFLNDEAPINPEDWVGANPKPHKMKWSDDIVVNYNKIHGFNNSMFKEEDVEVPDFITRIANKNNNYKKLINYINNGFPLGETPKNEEEFESLYFNMKDDIENDSSVSSHISEAGLKLLDILFNFHKNKMKYLDKESFENKVDKEEIEYWQEKYNRVKNAWKRFEDNKDELLSKYVNNIINLGQESEYIDINGVAQKVDEYRNFIDSLGMKSREGSALGTEFWGVGEDESNIVEIRTPILTTKDIPNLIKVLEELSKEPRDGSTSAHVHIGMPENTDAFDLIAMTTLADEKNIIKDAGKNRNFTYAAMNQVVHDNLYKILHPGVYTSDEIIKKIKLDFSDRNKGTNLKSFFEHGTVEYRYLSSQILDNIPRFIQWIQYYLMTPMIAQKRTQIVLKSTWFPAEEENPYRGQLIITRLPRGMIKIDKDVKSSSATNLPVKDLRKEQPINNNYKIIKAEKEIVKRKIKFLLELPVFYTNLKHALQAKISKYKSEKNPRIEFIQFVDSTPISEIWHLLNQKEKQQILINYIHLYN